MRVKKGLYVPGWRRGEERPVDSLVLAGLVYGPSYVSLETALVLYGMIPERVEEITCVTSKRARRFSTPLGRFTYQPVNERVFSYAVKLEQARGGSYFLAEPEKALCDRIALVRGLTAMRDVAALLGEELRIDPDAVRRSFRLPVVMEIADRYRRRNVRAFAKWLARDSRASTS